MYVSELIYNHEIGDLQPIQSNCSQFIAESASLPIVKYLPQTYNNVQKVKVRKHKRTNSFSSSFNDAFENEVNDLRERSIFVNGISSLKESNDVTMEKFYIFPINGYKFLYSKEVENSTDNYKQVFEAIFDQLGEQSGKEVFTDLLRFTYVSEDLSNGILSGAEIIIYGIPYYYAIRENYIDDYEELLTILV